MAVSFLPPELPHDTPTANNFTTGGQPNMYMQNHRCRVTGSTSTKKLGKPKAPVWCKEDQSKCVTGPKQMMAWNRKSTNAFL